MTLVLIQAPRRYKNESTNPALVYDSICKVLSDRSEQVPWLRFGVDEWSLLPRMAQIEGVGPLLYWHFKNSTWPPGIPKETAVDLMG